MLFPKPEKRRTARAREKRREREVIQRVRAECVARDGDCRLAGGALGPCSGASEWAHMEGHRRWETRGMDADERHDRRWSLMLCDGHHDAYDLHEMDIEALTERGADGPLRFTADGQTYTEAA